MRQRSHCVIKKKNSILDSNAGKDIDEHMKEIAEETKIEDTMKDLIVENDKFKKDKKFINRSSLKNFNDGFILNLKKPVFKNLKKEFKTQKPLLIHEKAQIVGNFEKTILGDIEEHVQVMDLHKFLYQFKSEEEVRNLEIQDLLDLDYEKLEELKYKAKEFIDATSIMIEEKQGQDTQSESDLLLFFSQKLQELLNNEINLQIFVNNLEKVKGLAYSNNGVKVFFKK